mmetsp:Transcript_41931/g.101040  ORF Transcript_41931/g.101040 Transcript_41931/m.101040 type:complete len:220 (-) Transcript_41931:1759-2418(-)
MPLLQKPHYLVQKTETLMTGCGFPAVIQVHVERSASSRHKRRRSTKFVAALPTLCPAGGSTKTATSGAKVTFTLTALSCASTKRPLKTHKISVTITVVICVPRNRLRLDVPEELDADTIKILSGLRLLLLHLHQLYSQIPILLILRTGFGWPAEKDNMNVVLEQISRCKRKRPTSSVAVLLFQYRAGREAGPIAPSGTNPISLEPNSLERLTAYNVSTM